MLGWPAASFRRIPREASAPEEEQTIDVPTAIPVMDGLVSLNEWHRRQPDLPVSDRRIEVASEVGRDLEDQEPDPVQRELPDLIGEGSTVGEILNRSPRTDAGIAAALLGYHELGVLRAGE